MSSLQSYCSLFSLDDFFDTEPVFNDKMIASKQPVLLLSQIKGIDRELIETLERCGIYDTDDFHLASPKLGQELNLSANMIQHVVNRINIAIKTSMQQPSVILDLPSNYALVTVFSDQFNYHVGFYWRGLNYKLKQSREENWSILQAEIIKIFERMDYPELIGRVSLNTAFQWQDQVTPLSTYLSNIPLDQPLLDTALDWGLPITKIQKFDKIDQRLLSLIYLVQLAKITEKTSKISQQI